LLTYIERIIQFATLKYLIKKEKKKNPVFFQNDDENDDDDDETEHEWSLLQSEYCNVNFPLRSTMVVS
jgi:hypothetical protein